MRKRSFRPMLTMGRTPCAPTPSPTPCGEGLGEGLQRPSPRAKKHRQPAPFGIVFPLSERDANFTALSDRDADVYSPKGFVGV